ncbi:RNA 2'-phosphotransferase [Granulibacter bethesdensis]|uniref:RNA 2'-phosphotransferase n=1 Tax=Granulibacter bethesdensis TaxID=364410 RepID=UPI00090C808B|nr:RNA 2'-phosphotransferase [Granulibacter bethesdensis]APG31153.1 tRNA 2'phosphotransferase [Granulibacter bethesdensis CGDNIH4]
MTQSLTTASKFLSYILRHKPDAIGLTLDPEGWANIQELIAKADITIDLELLHEVVNTSDKKRFAISNDGLYIRANQGHSIEVDLGLEPVEPPEFLYHGTADRFLDSIKNNGLYPQNRQYVHLSADTDTANKVGQRHGKPVILTIHALQMHQKGHEFFQAQNGVWLTKSVPTEAISGLNPKVPYQTRHQS